MYYEKEKSMGDRADDQQPARTMTKPKETFTMPTAPFGGQYVILPVLRRFKSPATQTETQHDILI
jgi:hypothetical protein